MWLLIDRGLYYLYVTHHNFLYKLFKNEWKQYCHTVCTFFSVFTSFTLQAVVWMKETHLQLFPRSDFFLHRFPLGAHECRHQCEFTSSCHKTLSSSSLPAGFIKNAGSPCFIPGATFKWKVVDLRCFPPPLRGVLGNKTISVTERIFDNLVVVSRCAESQGLFAAQTLTGFGKLAENRRFWFLCSVFILSWHYIF